MVEVLREIVGDFQLVVSFLMLVVTGFILTVLLRMYFPIRWAAKLGLRRGVMLHDFDGQRIDSYAFQRNGIWLSYMYPQTGHGLIVLYGDGTFRRVRASAFDQVAVIEDMVGYWRDMK